MSKYRSGMGLELSKARARRRRRSKDREKKSIPAAGPVTILKSDGEIVIEPAKASARRNQPGRSLK